MSTEIGNTFWYVYRYLTCFGDTIKFHAVFSNMYLEGKDFGVNTTKVPGNYQTLI